MRKLNNVLGPKAFIRPLWSTFEQAASGRSLTQWRIERARVQTRPPLTQWRIFVPQVTHFFEEPFYYRFGRSNANGHCLTLPPMLWLNWARMLQNLFQNFMKSFYWSKLVALFSLLYVISFLYLSGRPPLPMLQLARLPVKLSEFYKWCFKYVLRWAEASLFEKTVLRVKCSTVEIASW